MVNSCADEILVVDAEHESCTAISQFLANNGYWVQIAESGAAALELADERDFALVISDYSLPDMNGVELFVLLQKRRPKMRGIILSDDPLLNTIFAAISSGIELSLAKATELTDMLEVRHAAK